MIFHKQPEGLFAPRLPIKTTACLILLLVSAGFSCSGGGNGSQSADVDIEEESSEIEEGQYCLPGTYNCNLVDRVVCNDDGNGWLFVESCAPFECNQGECAGFTDGDEFENEPEESVDLIEKNEEEEAFDQAETEAELEKITELPEESAIEYEEEESCWKDRFGGLNGAEGNAQLITPPVNLTGLTVCGWEDDWFYVDLRQGESIKAAVLVDNGWGDIDVKLYSKGHNGLSDYVAAAITGDKRDALIYNNAAAGRYFLRIQGYELSSLYSLSVSVSVNGFGDGSDTCVSPAPLYFNIAKEDTTLSAYDNYHCSCSPALGAEVV